VPPVFATGCRPLQRHSPETRKPPRQVAGRRVTRLAALRLGAYTLSSLDRASCRLPIAVAWQASLPQRLAGCWLGFISPEGRVRAHLVFHSSLGEIAYGTRASRAARLCEPPVSSTRCSYDAERRGPQSPTSWRRRQGNGWAANTVDRSLTCASRELRGQARTGARSWQESMSYRARHGRSRRGPGDPVKGPARGCGCRDRSGRAARGWRLHRCTREEGLEGRLDRVDRIVATEDPTRGRTALAARLAGCRQSLVERLHSVPCSVERVALHRHPVRIHDRMEIVARAVVDRLVEGRSPCRDQPMVIAASLPVT
jgi:hypothetical protein